MKKLLLLLLLTACQTKAQVDLNTLKPEQWQADLDALTSKIDSRFAGFTPGLKLKFDEEAARIRNKIPALSVSQRVMEFARLLALLNDGHTEISIVGRGSGFGRLPIILFYFGNDLRIISAAPSFDRLLGMKVTRIGNSDVSSVFEQLKPYMNKDNDVEFITTAPVLMAIPEVLEVLGVVPSSTSIPLTLEDDSGASSEITLPRLPLGEYTKTEFVRIFEKTPLYLEGTEKGYVAKFLENEKIMYVNFITLYNKDGQPSVKSFIHDVFDLIDEKKPIKVVFDFRLCRGGNYHHAEPLIAGIKKRAWLNQKNKLFVVNGRTTFSAASTATLFFKEETQATIVGEVSRSRPNWAENMESYDLPNTGLNYDVLDKTKVLFPALGNPDTIPVDVEIPRSYEHYKKGDDEVLEYILSVR